MGKPLPWLGYYRYPRKLHSDSIQLPIPLDAPLLVDLFSLLPEDPGPNRVVAVALSPSVWTPRVPVALLQQLSLYDRCVDAILLHEH